MALATALSSSGDAIGNAFISAMTTAYSAGQFRRKDASTPDGVRRELAERDVVHISATLVPNQHSPLRSRLLMVDEPGRRYSGSVSASQLAGSSTMRARLVAFDAQTARRGDVSEGISGFAIALLAKGVSAVVGPNVQMPASDLDQTWLDFHRHYAAGTTASESLQRAQLAALDESNRRIGPWATLTVFGATE
jgi:CHAT domain-containing protein